MTDTEIIEFIDNLIKKKMDEQMVFTPLLRVNMRDIVDMLHFDLRERHSMDPTDRNMLELHVREEQTGYRKIFPINIRRF